MLHRFFTVLLTLSLVATPLRVIAQSFEQLIQQGNALYDQKKLAQAIASYQKAIQLNPNSAAAYNNLGNALRDQKKLTQAIANYQKSIQLDPNDATPYNGLGNALKDQGKLAEAIANYQKSIQLDPNDATPYNGLGNALKDQGKLAEAIANYQKSIQLDPNDATPYNGLGNALKDQGKLAEAIASYQKSIQLDPNYAMAYNNLGLALYDQKKLEEAIAAYQKSIQLDPNYAMAYNNLGLALYDQKKLAEAIANYRKALSLPDTPSTPVSAHVLAYNNLGLALYDQKKLEEAIAAYQKSIQLDPNYAMAYNGLGNALYDQKKLAQAIAAYQKSIQLDPNYAYAYNNLGIALYDQGKLEEAIANYRKALNLPEQRGTPASAHTLAHSNLGFALQQQGNLEAAIEEFQRSIDLDHNFVKAQNNLREAQRLLALRRNPQSVVKDDQWFLPSQEDEPLVSVLRSTALIITQIPRGYSKGAGWVVKREGDAVWIVTNCHVISDDSVTKRPSDKIEVEFFSELPTGRRPRYEATIEHMTDPKNPDPDLAVLKVTGIPPDIQPLKLHPGRISRNTRVRVIGHPINAEKPWNSASGEVTNYDPQGLLPINANVAEGDSGGPVIDEQNQVIGVIVRFKTKNDVALNANEPSPDLSEVSPATGGVGFAYRIDMVIEKLREWHILN